MATIAEQSAELRMATFRLSRRLRAQKADQALSDAQFAVLGRAVPAGRPTLTQLAERERVSAPSMNRTVNCLEETGYLSASPTTSTAARPTSALTTPAATLVKATTSKRDAWLTTRLRELSKEDRAMLARAAELMGGLATQ